MPLVLGRLSRSTGWGLMGHYGEMLDIATDLTQVCITFGCHIEHIEVDPLSALRTAVNSSEIEDRIAHLKDQLEIQPGCTEEELARAARTSVALDRLAELHDLYSLALLLHGPWRAGERRDDGFHHSRYIVAYGAESL